MLDTESLREAASCNFARYFDRPEGVHVDDPMALMFYHRAEALCETVAMIEGVDARLVANQAILASRH
jgi:hypothetical protein